MTAHGLAPPKGAADWPTFIRDHTVLTTPPLVPEVRLYLATESVPIWQKTEEELDALNVPPPFWAFAWAGGQALARYVLDTPDVVSGKRVLDLGAGSGLTAIAPLLAGAQRAFAADIDEVALIAAHLNADANSVSLETGSADLLDGSADAYDVICIGDLFYERQLAERVLGLVDRAKAAGKTVLIGDPQRSYFPRGRFTQCADYRVPVTRELEDAEIKHTAVWMA
ncbi:MAG: hypothetical protein RL291_304 [Pseudomonadota bacterium]